MFSPQTPAAHLHAIGERAYPPWLPETAAPESHNSSRTLAFRHEVDNARIHEYTPMEDPRELGMSCSGRAKVCRDRYACGERDHEFATMIRCVLPTQWRSSSGC